MSLRPQIQEALSRGQKGSEIARAFGCSTAYVSNIKNENDTLARIPVNLKIKIAYHWGCDRCVPWIAGEFNLSQNRIIKFLQDEGLLE